MNELINNLDNLSIDSKISHLILNEIPLIVYGPARCGKTFRIMNVLKSQGIDVNVSPDTVAFSKNQEKNTNDYWITLRRSLNHTELDVNDIFCNDTTLVKEIVILILNKINLGNTIHYIIIRHFENISCDAQFMLRRLIETSENCKFIFVVRNLGKVIEAIKSRSISYRIRGSSIEKDIIGENYTYWQQDVHDFCISPSTQGIYSMLMNLIEPTDIFKEMLFFLSKKYPEKAYDILKIIAKCEHNCALGTKPVIHIEHCVNLLRDIKIFDN